MPERPGKLTRISGLGASSDVPKGTDRATASKLCLHQQKRMRSPTPPKRSTRTSYQSDDEQDENRSYRGDEGLIDKTGSYADPQPREQPAANESAYDSNRDIADETEAPAGHYLSRQPSGNEANQQDDEQVFA
jgi:hypothetical protein